MNTEISNYLFKNNLTGHSDILTLISGHEDIALKAFKKMDKQKPQMLESKAMQFKRLFKNALRESGNEHRKRQELEQQRRWTEEHNISKQKGFVASPEQLRKQLDELLDKGTITTPQYEAGIKQIENVLELIANNEPESPSLDEEDELDEIPF